MLIRTLFVLAAITSVGAPVYAWGPEGHSITGHIAYRFLTPSASAKIEKLLQRERISTLAEATNWADEVKGTSYGDERKPWHYVDIPVTQASYKQARDCASADSCIVAKLEEFKQTLRTATPLSAKQGEAFKWIAHLVGDLHQPLHTAEGELHGEHDQGGGKVRLKFFGQPSNLHRVWDSGLIHQIFPGKTAAQIADEIGGGISDQQRQQWCRGNTTDWANESHALGVSVAYGRLPRTADINIGPKYRDQVKATLVEQLKKGGARLACVLNAALD